MTKQLFLLSSIITSGTFFQSFVAFSERLDFKEKHNNGHFILFLKLRCEYIPLINTILKYKFWHHFLNERSLFNARFVVPSFQERLIWEDTGRLIMNGKSPFNAKNAILDFHQRVNKKAHRIFSLWTYIYLVRYT